MDCSTSGFPVLHYLPEFAQIHVHCVSDAIQPAHPLSSPSPPAFNLSQHQSLFQRHSLKALILWCSAFFMVQLSYLYMTIGKTVALTIQTFVVKMSLLFNMLSRLVIAFLPRGKRLLISWLQSPSVVILEPKKIKSVTVSIVSPSICREVMGPDTMVLIFCMLNFKPAFTFSLLTFRSFFTQLQRARLVR